MTLSQLAESGSGFLPPCVPAPTVQLRPRQEQALVALFRRFSQGVRQPLVVLPTGVGKTIYAGNVSGRFRRTLFLVHRGELMDQTVRMYERLFPGEKVGRIHGSAHDVASDFRFVVGMIPTIASRLKAKPGEKYYIDPNAFDLVCIDEAHHSAADTWRRVAEYFQPDMRLGLSATPERADGAPLNHIFSEIVYQCGIPEVVAERLLVPPDVRRIKTNVFLGKVRTSSGDFSADQLDSAVNIPERNQLVVDRYLELAGDGKNGGYRKGVVFCVSIDHAQKIAELFQEAGVAADAVWGDDPDRAEKLRKLRDGELTVLCNSMILTEGWDEPSVSCCVLARPTMSRSLYVQMIGRALRLYPGKKDALIIDFVDNAGKHSLTTAWAFFGDPEKQEQARKGDGKRREPHARDIDPDVAFDNYAALGGRLNLYTFAEKVSILRLPPEVESAPFGSQAWHAESATAQQRQILSTNGYDVTTTDWTKGQAQYVIETFPPTAKQTFMLLAYGYDVFTRHWIRKEVDRALADAKFRGVKPDWQRVAKFIPNYRAMWEK